MTSIENKIKDVIRDIPDFPKQGILFKDITPIMMDPILSNDILNELFEKYKSEKINAIAGIESRGFLFGYPLAMKLNIPFIWSSLDNGTFFINSIEFFNDFFFKNASLRFWT